MKISISVSQTIACILVTLLSLFAQQSLATSIDADTPCESAFRLTLDGRQFPMKDSVELSAKGVLNLYASVNPAEAIQFRIVIRHQNFKGLLFTTIDERYEDGKIFTSVEIEKILSKASANDEILILPVGKDNQNSSMSPLVLQVTLPDRC